MKKLFTCFTLLTIFGLEVFARDSAQKKCFRALSPSVSYAVRKTTDSIVDIRDDASYLSAMKQEASDGKMRSFFDKELDTRIYHTVGDGEVVNKSAKSLYIFIHGSGTMNSSGRNFAKQMNQLAELGYASLSFDMPFHKDGPIDSRQYSAEFFMKWVNQIIEKYRVAGMPVYLVGHSHGPDVIAEYLTQYPRSVDGALLISPAVFNPTLEKWYNQVTSKMKFGGDVQENTLAAEWAGETSEKFKWRATENNVDPSKLNPDLNIRVLIGDREEYVPGPVGGKKGLPIGPNTYDMKKAITKLIQNAQVVIEEGIGHYIFDYTDKEGVKVVLREMMILAGENPKAIEQIRGKENKGALDTTETLKMRYYQDSIFGAWILSRMSEKQFFNLMDQRNERISKNIQAEYDTAKKMRERIIISNMKKTEEYFPEFFARFKTQLAKDSDDRSFLLLAYADLASGLDDERRSEVHPRMSETEWRAYLAR